MRAEHQRRRRAVRRKRSDKPARGVGGVCNIGHRCFFRQRGMFQPVEQRSAEPSNDAQLWIVDVRVHEPWQHDAVTPIDDRGAGIHASYVVKAAARDDASVTHEQSPISVDLEGAVLAKGIGAGVEQSGAKELRSAAHRRAVRSARTRRTAKNTRSGVAGLSNVTTSPAPNAAIASRSASRTEMASISGGSPTALLPNTTAGWAAPWRKLTRKSSGISDQDGSLYVDAPA